MKRSRLFTTICLMAAILFTACTQDELSSPSEGVEGAYPLQIGSVTMSVESSEQPWTRVSENDDGNGSVFEDGDVIGVRIGDSEETGEYRLIVKNGQVTGVEPVKPVYWQSTLPATVTAWYPLDEEIDFTQQDQGLVYLLKANVTASYNAPVTLTFTHQLAKVRVTLTGNRASAVSAVTVRSHVSTGNDEGSRGTDSQAVQYVPMLQTSYNGQTCWEATLLPGTLVADNSFRLTPTGGGNPVQATLTGDVPIVAGSLHEITISLVEVIHGNGYTIIPSTHTITLESGTSLTSEMISQALDGTGTLVINGEVNLKDLDTWFNYCNQITNLTLTNVSNITNYGIFTYTHNLTELNLPNVVSIAEGALTFCTRLTVLKLTSASGINIQNAMTSNIAGRTTLTLNANKQDEVNGNQWGGFTWAAIEFE